MSRSSTPGLVLGALLTACSGSHFDVVVLSNVPAKLYAGSTSGLVAEHGRAREAATEGIVGAEAKFSAAFTAFTEVPASAVAIAADGRLAANPTSSTRIGLFSLVDGAARGGVDVASVDRVVAVSEDGARVLYATVPPARYRLVEVQSSADVELSWIPEGTRPLAAFAGATLYVGLAGALHRVASDGTSVTLATPKPHVVELVAEPRSDRVWGIATSGPNQRDGAVFRVGAGAAEATGAPGLPDFPQRLTAGLGGRLALIGGTQVYLTGPEGADPTPALAGTVSSGVAMLALAPDGSGVVQLVGNGLSYTARSAESWRDVSAVTADFTPLLVVTRL